ncbi:hypothetical protein CG709_10190 [Lachnotalea glycerini]|nr:hypothetical protein CG709_10190 [Lachnotalea glycerini]
MNRGTVIVIDFYLLVSRQRQRSIPLYSSAASGVYKRPTGSISSSGGDLAMLAAIIQCEAGGESTEGKLAVGSVVINRVRSSAYPNTVVGVIYQSGQFTPVASGRFALVLSQGASSSCTSAAQQVLNGYSSGSWLHFKVANPEIDGTVIGNHVFY